MSETEKFIVLVYLIPCMLVQFHRPYQQFMLPYLVQLFYRQQYIGPSNRTISSFCATLLPV
jgi:hypothetical protein